MLRAVFIGLALIASQVAPAQDFPARPVRLIVAYPPGGGTDILARLLARELAPMWKQTVIVDNRAGAGGTIGTDLVAKGTPDGHTLLFSSPASITSNLVLYGKLPFYDPLVDLAPITLLVSEPSVMVAGPAVPAKSVAEFIALAKARPGKLNYASGGVGNPGHLMGAVFMNMAGIDVVHVPYKGTAPAITDLVGGQVEVMFNTIRPVLTTIKAGRLRALAVTTPARFALLSDVPTMTEVGMPQMKSTGWYGVLAPGKTPRQLVSKLNADVVAAFSSPAMKERLLGEGTEVIGSSPAQFSEHIRQETDKARKVIKTTSAMPE